MPKSENQGSMRTARRMLEVFEVFAAQRRPLTLSELAVELDAPVSSCFGLVKILTQHGYVHTVGSRKELYPTRRMLQNTNTIAQNEPVLPRLTSTLETLRDQTRETVIVGQLDSSHVSVMYVAVFEGLEIIRYSAFVGQTRPVDRAATGKALLSALPQAKLATVLKRLKPAPGVDRETHIEALLDEIAQGRERGFQMHRGQNVVDVESIARPIMVGDRLLSVGVAGPMHRMEENMQERVAALVRACEVLERLT